MALWNRLRALYQFNQERDLRLRDAGALAIHDQPIDRGLDDELNDPLYYLSEHSTLAGMVMSAAVLLSLPFLLNLDHSMPRWFYTEALIAAALAATSLAPALRRGRSGLADAMAGGRVMSLFIAGFAVIAAVPELLAHLHLFGRGVERSLFEWGAPPKELWRVVFLAPPYLVFSLCERIATWPSEPLRALGNEAGGIRKVLLEATAVGIIWTAGIICFALFR
jgi:hypothetical protein